MSELTTRVVELAPYRDVPIAIHCHHGGRSLRVANWLRAQGFAQAQVPWPAASTSGPSTSIPVCRGIEIFSKGREKQENSDDYL